eukprot:gb/GFBE01046985.1/.p1 GENE.gb/GFBE01046985.1/~~gb/GFBE01046985.1/.p1  ORF type:complete len:320 (+),score=39.59 gb/GFBE01046985.1/:1-960(+)
MHGPPLPQTGASIRDPFGWKEALTPQNVSPVVSARNSRAGSNASTPRNATPPLSPAFAPGSGGSARSSRSNLSGRSACSGRGSYTPSPAEAFVCGGYPTGPFPDLSARTDRTSNFYTPEPSARSSEFVSVYDAGSVAGSARIAELASLSEQGLTYSPPVERAREATDRKKQKAMMAAALEAFVPSPSSERPSTTASSPGPPVYDDDAEASLDPRQVFSAARHGRHKEVEASLVAGFNPDYADSFGNTLFHVACQNGNKRIAKLAIKYGGDMDAQNVKGHTGLHFLFSYGYPDIAEYFISKGADDQVVNEVGKTPREGIR